ncbi:unnamed protein product [marine sediment metagenome]|uniref:Uncharacterized protein n=1 Tax=marine sediment metagenome TaxID=412755 RepID=X1FCC2_9ZZZZ
MLEGEVIASQAAEEFSGCNDGSTAHSSGKHENAGTELPPISAQLGERIKFNQHVQGDNTLEQPNPEV